MSESRTQTFMREKHVLQTPGFGRGYSGVCEVQWELYRAGAVAGKPRCRAQFGDLLLAIPPVILPVLSWREREPRSVLPGGSPGIQPGQLSFVEVTLP